MMDEVQETELHEAVAGLGNWHQAGAAGGDQKPLYLANREECISCLKDLQINLKQDSQVSAYASHLKLGDWKVLPNHLVPLFTSYREDADISALVLKVLVQLTLRCELYGQDQMRHLEHLQDYKEAFAKKDVFIILMGLLVENMEEEEEAEDAPAKENRAGIFNWVLELLRNLVAVPDPASGEPGYTPMRRDLQMVYIRHFHDEGVLDFFLLFAEGLASEQDAEKKGWALADILYNICAHVDPESLTLGNKTKDRNALEELMAREMADQRLRTPMQSRHCRFGTCLSTRTAEGKSSLTTSVLETWSVSKGSHLYRREFHDPGSKSEKKVNMFHDPFFIDLEEGSVRDHNQLNAKVKNVMDIPKTLPEAVLGGLRKFFEEFLHTSFSSLVHLLRSNLGPSVPAMAKPGEERHGGIFDRPKLLNFLSWFLEFHRHHHAAGVSKYYKEKEQQKEGSTPPVIDIASIQGAIDLDMIQFTASRLREYGKESNFHVSHLVVTLRALAQQVKTVDVVMEAKDSDTRECGEILLQNMVKDNILSNISWILKNFKTSSHDPRIMSYAVEVFHYMLKLMKTLSDRKGQKLEFQVEAVGARSTKRSVTSMEQEVGGLADARVVENLFHLLEKYKVHSSQMNSILVKLIYAIIRARRENIVVFFELTYFLRIQRIWADPLVRDKKQGKKYHEMVSLLQYILRQFFKCAEKNHCVFVELLFRKVPETSKTAILESHAAEFAAILDNYENEEYKQVLEQMRAGETLDTMRSRQRALQTGTLPWTKEEDEILRQRHATYAEHPLCAELLAAELPEETQRTGIKVRKRLVELGLVLTSQQKAEQRKQEQERQRELRESLAATRLEDSSLNSGQPPLKKQKQADGMEDVEADLERLLDEAMAGDTQQESPGTAPTGGATQQMDEAFLELDLDFLVGEALKEAQGAAQQQEDQEDSLERLMDEALNSQLPGDLADSLDPPQATVQESTHAGTAAATRLDTEATPKFDTEAAGEVDDTLEMQLESLLEEGLFDEPSQAAAPTDAATRGSPQAASEQHAQPTQPEVPRPAASAQEPRPASTLGGGLTSGTPGSDFEPSRQYAVGGGGTSNATGDPASASAIGQAEVATAGSAEASVSEAFDLDRALESQMDKDPELIAQLQAAELAAEAAGRAATGGASGATADAAGSGGSQAGHQPAQPQPSASQEAGLDLEMELEGLMDQDEDMGVN